MQAQQANLITEADDKANMPAVNGYELRDRLQIDRPASEQKIPQSQWRRIVSESCYTFPVAALATGIHYDQFMKYLNEKIQPRRKNRETMEEFMAYFNEKKKIPFHPSYGYATPEQIEKLNSLPDGYELQHLKKQIEKQNKNKGKTS